MVVKLLILFCLTLIFIILLFILEKDKINVLYKLCYTFIISGSFIVIIGLLFKFIVKSNISFINIGEATNSIVKILGKDLESEDSYIRYKALIKLREDNKLEFKDGKYKEEYKEYCEQLNDEE